MSTEVTSTPPAPRPQPAPSHSPEQVKAYHAAKRGLMIAGIVISLAYWATAVIVSPSLVEWVAGLTDSRWLGLFLTALILLGVRKLIDLPLDYYGDFILEHRFQLSNQTPKAWFIFQLKGLLVGVIIGGILLVGLYAALWYSGRWWGVWVWVGIMLLGVGLAKVFPLLILPLFYPSKPLNRPSLTDRLTRLAGGTGMTLTGTYELELSKETRKANAMLAGLGSSRRVYLSDTLLDAFNDDEISVVFAHELGHHIHGHIWKGIGITAVASSILVGLIYWRLNPYAGTDADWTGAVAAFAQIMLISSVYPLLISPITNAISRHFERQCDWDALRLTDDPASFRSAFERLVQVNLADPNPPRWEEILFDDHPAMSKRIAMADAYIRSRQ